MPSACFQGVDTLPFALKHAEGMSLRYDESDARSKNRIKSVFRPPPVSSKLPTAKAIVLTSLTS